jgi:hypothetical protein
VVVPTVSVSVRVPVGIEDVSFGAHGVETTCKSATVAVKIYGEPYVMAPTVLQEVPVVTTIPRVTWLPSGVTVTLTGGVESLPRNVLSHP